MQYRDVVSDNGSNQDVKSCEKVLAGSDNCYLYENPGVMIKQRSKRGNRVGKHCRLWLEDIKRKQQSQDKLQYKNLCRDKTKGNPDQRLSEKDKLILEMVAKDEMKRKKRRNQSQRRRNKRRKLNPELRMEH